MQRFILGFALALVCVSTALAQQTGNSSSAVVPRLVRFGGVAKDASGKPVTGTTGMTFALYQDQEGGTPLWIETQNVLVDSSGHYTVSLGSTQPGGLPARLFATGDARWLGVQVAGQDEQARILLQSVPYAMKAVDAETLGGLPASAFALAVPSTTIAASATSGTAASSSSSASAALAPANVTGTGTVGFVPLWTSTSNIGNSVLFQSGTGGTAKVGINTGTPATTLDVKGPATVRGTLQMPNIGTATATSGFSSQPANWTASAFNSGTATAVNQVFQWQSEPTGNNTATPSGTFNLLFASGTGKPAETGLKISSKGLFTFATGQTFPGVGTITGITTATGSGLTGGGTSGTLTLSLLKTCATNQVLQWNGAAWVCSAAGSGTITGVTAGNDLTGGGTSGNVTVNLDATKVPLLAAANTFATGQTVKGNVTLSGTGNGIVFADGTKQTTAASGGGGGGTVTSVALSAPGSDFTVSGSPITTSGTLNLGWTVAPTSTNTANTIVKRDSSGNFSTNSVSANSAFVNGTVAGVAGSFSGGLAASTLTEADFATGILGEQFATNRAGIGVEGFGNSLLGVGVWGNTYTQSNEGAGLSAVFPIGVWGDTGLTGGFGMLATVDDGASVGAVNNSQSYVTGDFENDDITATGTVLETIGLYGNNGFGGVCFIDVNGILSCNGFLSSVAPVDNGTRNVALYSVQSPENWFEDFGSGQLSNGAATINLEPTFGQTVNTNTEYHVFLTPNGDSRGLYVAQKSATSFVVREQGAGTSNIAFDYRIVARRKGFENMRLADKTAQFHNTKAFALKKRAVPLKIPTPSHSSSTTAALTPVAAAGAQ